MVNTYKQKSKIATSNITAKIIYEKALAGNPTALETFNYTEQILSIAIASSVAHTNPEAIFIFWGIAQASG
jgi:glucokinase